MPGVERSPINPPNDSLKTLAEKRSMTPSASGPAVRSPDFQRHTADPNGSGPEPKSASPVHAPDHRFNIENARMPQPPAATMPGQGDVPVDLRVYSQPATGMARQDTGKTSR
jgi:hypothetical protein